MSAMRESTTGIPNADKPGWWIVPPWPVPASLCEVVSHFLRFAPRDNASVTVQLAYYRGYLAAIDAAPTQELKYHCDWNWSEELRDCIGRCVTLYQDKRAADIQRANRNVRSLPPAARATTASPAPQERAS